MDYLERRKSFSDNPRSGLTGPSRPAARPDSAWNSLKRTHHFGDISCIRAFLETL